MFFESGDHHARPFLINFCIYNSVNFSPPPPLVDQGVQDSNHRRDDRRIRVVRIYKCSRSLAVGLSLPYRVVVGRDHDQSENDEAL